MLIQFTLRRFPAGFFNLNDKQDRNTYKMVTAIDNEQLGDQ